MYDRAWLEENLAFLRQTLTSDYVVERVAAAAKNLRGEPEESLARRIADDAEARADVIALRIDDMRTNLAKTTLSKDRWD